VVVDPAPIGIVVVLDGAVLVVVVVGI